MSDTSPIDDIHDAWAKSIVASLTLCRALRRAGHEEAARHAEELRWQAYYLVGRVVNGGGG